MKANEYFKKHGYKKCKAACAQNGWLNTGFWIQLKRLIKSYELIALFDDIDCAKAWVSDLDSDWPYQVKGADTKFFKWQLEQAILDVESCQ